MRRFFCLISLLCCTLANAAGQISDIASALASGAVSFRYSFEVRSDVPMSGNGTATLLGDAYHVAGNGMEFICDGKTRWTLDRTAKEAYIETVDADEVDYMANPAVLLASLGEAFQRASQKSTVFDGHNVVAFRLVPSIAGTGLDSVVLYVEGATPRGASIVIEDGTETVFHISGFKVEEKTDVKFSFDIGSLDSSYVVTDLR